VNSSALAASFPACPHEVKSAIPIAAIVPINNFVCITDILFKEVTKLQNAVAHRPSLIIFRVSDTDPNIFLNLRAFRL
jgi:hypothetical protein